MPCRHLVTLPIMWVSPRYLLHPPYTAMIGGIQWSVETKELNHSEEGGEELSAWRRVMWGAGGCKNILPNFSFCF